jgi:hypothetical protein
LESQSGCGCVLLFFLLLIGLGAWSVPKLGRVEIETAREGDFRGVFASDAQFDRLEMLADNPRVGSVLLFPVNGRPEETAKRFGEFLRATK